MEATKSAKQRFRQYPALLAHCGKAAKKYATCSITSSHLSKNDCLQEFNELKACLLKAAATKNTKL